MKRAKRKEVGTEIECPECDGTGFPQVRQPAQPGRKIYPPPCKRCLGKGRIERTPMPRGDRGLKSRPSPTLTGEMRQSMYFHDLNAKAQAVSLLQCVISVL